MIELKNISKSYGGVCALRGVDLHIKKGDFIALTGPSGSGKSTLMNIIGLLDMPSGGSYTLCGEDVMKLGKHAAARIRNTHIGFVFQSFNLLPELNALENVELPMLYAGVNAEARKKRASELLFMAGLEKREKHLPGELSGGQCQRVAIARAMANSPDVLLADEPTGNLDPQTGRDIMRMFGELNRVGTTIILVTHDKDAACAAYRRAVIKDGILSEMF